ncbi:LemA family protein [Coralloluteibacterium stylophorae]|uniref:LemA family protein n=1 Tax=Coralloluteibacterium stylophorae TaxID=1776034 RepID=A0A8J7VU16_9GAMM|nr:LemA family protein [Coralloluteibacterium stylophorae]MBS7455856.1 LemA family protein [Coralloluteibacterium stylophorae]
MQAGPWIAVTAVALAALWAVVVFNRLVRLRNRVRSAWADIDVQLTRRHDLVPMLVEAVRGHAAHERATIEAATALRAQALASSRPPELAAIEDALGRSLARLLALREAYPDLDASANFAQLQRDLVGIEEQLQYARRFYNGAVRDLNDGVQRVPDRIVATAAGVRAAEFYEPDPAARAAPVVEATR